PHVSCDQAAVSCRDQVTGDLDAVFQGLYGLVTRHRRALCEIGCSSGDLSGDQPRGLWQITDHPDVDDGDLRTDLCGEGVDDGATFQEVVHHLFGDLLWPG